MHKLCINIRQKLSKMKEVVKNLQKKLHFCCKMKEINKKFQKNEKNIQKGVDKSF